MENITWRRRARVVAWLDMIFMVLSLIWLIIVAVLFTTQPQHMRIRVTNIIQSNTAITNRSNELDLTSGYDLNTSNDGVELVISDEERNNDPDFDQKVTDGVFYAMLTIWICIAITIIITVIKLAVTVMLIRATERNAEMKTSLRKSRTWLIVTLIMLVVSTLKYTFTMDFIALGITVLLRLIFLLVVYFFMEELRQAVATSK